MISSDLISLLEAYIPYDRTEAAHLAAIRELVASSENFACRSRLEGHLTASGFVLNPSGTKALLLLHATLGKWLQPGGHIEPEDVTIDGAALREVMEEVGIPGGELVCEGLLDVDVHTIPAKPGVPGHQHFDIRFRFSAKSEDVILSAESHGYKWVDLTELCSEHQPASLRRMALKSRTGNIV